MANIFVTFKKALYTRKGHHLANKKRRIIHYIIGRKETVAGEEKETDCVVSALGFQLGFGFGFGHGSGSGSGPGPPAVC